LIDGDAAPQSPAAAAAAAVVSDASWLIDVTHCVVFTRYTSINTRAPYTSFHQRPIQTAAITGMQPLRRHRAIFAREKYRQSLAYLICLLEIVTTKNNFLTQNA